MAIMKLGKERLYETTASLRFRKLKWMIASGSETQSSHRADYVLTTRLFTGVAVQPFSQLQFE